MWTDTCASVVPPTTASGLTDTHASGEVDRHLCGDKLTDIPFERCLRGGLLAPGYRGRGTFEEFWRVFEGTFAPSCSETDRNAIFKRCMTLLFTKHRVVLRLPSENPTAPLYVIEDTQLAGAAG